MIRLESCGLRLPEAIDPGGFILNTSHRVGASRLRRVQCTERGQLGASQFGARTSKMVCGIRFTHWLGCRPGQSIILHAHARYFAPHLVYLGLLLAEMTLEASNRV